MNVNILGSSSAGNCAVIDDFIVIDCGITYSGPAEHVLLTHHHSDHTKRLCDVGGLSIYATEATASKLLEGKYPYISFNKVCAGMPIKLEKGLYTYIVTPFLVKHDAPCVGYDIARLDEIGCIERILFSTDFNSIVDEQRVIRDIKDQVYDEIYIECNNSLTHANFTDIFFLEEGEKEPRDAFHRRKSYENHCNVAYLIGLFRAAGYSEIRPFTEPVTLLHKSSFYYTANVEMLAELKKIANIKNILYNGITK